MRNTLPILFVILISGSVFGQANPWSDIQEHTIDVEPQTRDIIPNVYRTLKLDQTRVKSLLTGVPGEAEFVYGEPAVLIDFPLPGGGYSRFEVWEAPVMAPELTAKYPDIRSYAGRNRQGDFIRFAVSPLGLDALILPVDRSGTYLIKQYARGSTEDYLCFYQRDCPIPAGHRMECLMEEVENEMEVQAVVSDRAGSCGNLRTYRLALACTGEFANFWGSFGTDKVAVLAAMNACMTTVNGIFEIDAGLRMIIIANNDLIIYTDTATDPYTNEDLGAMLSENVINCDNVIGTANYDIGHVFGQGIINSASQATLSCVCGINKARTASRPMNPASAGFHTLVAHEMGHQFGAAHTMYNNCAGGSRIEPGSGSTIMSYATSTNCTPRVQTMTDPYFHANSIEKIATFINGTANACTVLVPNGNSGPTCNALVNKTIPKSTPFILTATAFDPDGDVLSYCWEQMDAYKTPEQPMPPLSTNKNGPMFRSLLPNTSPSRYFPKFATVLSNTNDPWEVLPAPTTQNRTLNFRVTIRDNHADGGCTTEKNIVVTVSKSAGPFLVTQPNTAVNWPGNSPQTVTWNVAGTTANGINCANVAILLTTDGGSTFTTLLASTPNDGSQAVTIPNVSTTQARIMVQAVGNCFYDISNVDFTITPVPSMQFGSTERSGRESLSVFPNPSNGMIQVDVPTNWQNIPLVLRIRDMNGRLLLEDPSFISGNDVEVMSFARGVYQIELILNSEKIQSAFVRQ